MKRYTINHMVGILLGIVLLLASCDAGFSIKSDPPTLQVSDQLIQSFVEEAVDLSSMGLCYDFKEATMLADNTFVSPYSGVQCGEKTDSIISYAYANEAHTLGYEGHCSWLAYCHKGLPFTLDFQMNLNFDHLTDGLPRLTTTTARSLWAVTNLPELSNYRIQGFYTRDGYYKLGAAWDEAYYYKIDFKEVDLNLNPEQLQPVEGTVYYEGYVKDITVTGMGPTKSFEGVIHFNENGWTVKSVEL